MQGQEQLANIDKSASHTSRKRKRKNESLAIYQSEILGIDTDQLPSEALGKYCIPNRYTESIVHTEDDSAMGVEVKTDGNYGTTNDANVGLAPIATETTVNQNDPPTVVELLKQQFGQPDTDHSFTQEGAYETVLFLFLKHGRDYLSKEDIKKLHDQHVLIEHLDKMMVYYSKIDFSPLREPDPNYASQDEIPLSKVKMFMACLFHYDLSVANVMRYVGDEYTGGYRDVQETIEILKEHGIDEYLLELYARVMLVGAPAHFNYESSRENALLHWRKGNDKSIRANMPVVEKAMNKLDKNKFVMVFRSWIARFVPNIFFTPHNILVNKGNRIIFDASRRYTPTSIPVNMMTSTKLGVELDCDYGTVLTRLLVRIWNLRITYPNEDIVLHANDVKSCFRQMKHHEYISTQYYPQNYRTYSR